jgi:hypothetical protein
MRVKIKNPKKSAVIGAIVLVVAIAGSAAFYFLSSYNHGKVAGAQTSDISTTTSVTTQVSSHQPVAAQTSQQASVRTTVAGGAPVSTNPTTSPTSTDAGPSLNPANTLNPSAGKGSLLGVVTTEVGGQVCGNPGSMCQVAYVTDVTVKDTNGNVVMTTTTGQDGTFGFKLKPGTYRISVTDHSDSFITPSSQTVSITAGNTTNISFFYQPLAETN